MKKIISIILSMCIMLGCFVTVAGASTDNVKIEVVKAPKSIKLGQSIEDVGGYEVVISNLDKYVGGYYYVYPELDGAAYFHIDCGGGYATIENNVLTLNRGWVDFWEYYAPGKITVKVDITDGKGSGISKTLFEVIVEEPVIKTNAPSQVLSGATVTFNTELTNVGTKNIKIEDYDNPITELEDFEEEFKDYLTYADEYPLAYQPTVEIIQGQNLVKQSSQNYSNILNTSEKLTFSGEGVVKLKVKYNQLNPDDYNAEWSTSLNGVWNEDSEYEYIEYSPEKIITINVNDAKNIPTPNKTYTGLFKHNSTWYYAKNGVVDVNYTGLCKYNNAWYYVENGVLNWSKTGLVKHTNGVWYYVENGKINFNKTGVVRHTNNVWYYVEKGQIKWSKTGVIKSESGSWLYIKGGQVDFSKNGLVKSDSGSWLYIKNGRVDFSKTGLVKHTNNVWYYVQNGRINFSKTGLVKHTNGVWYYVQGGQIKWSKTGLVKHTDGHLYYVKNGQINWNYTGNATYNGKTYKVVKGKV